MPNKEIPLFSLVSSNEYIFIAGGGGAKEYGKGNGVMAIKKTEMKRDNSTENVRHFYRTNDLILCLQIYSEKQEEQGVFQHEINLEDAPPLLENASSHDTEMTIPFDKESSSSSEDVEGEIGIDRYEANWKSQNTLNSKQKAITVKRNPAKDLFVLAIGDENLYILKFGNGFSLHCKYEKKVKFAILNKHLFLLRNQEISGYFDIIKNPSSLRFQPDRMEEIVEDPLEEYVYKLYKRRTSVVPLNEHLSDDIPKDWDGFFIVGNKMHKILKTKEKIPSGENEGHVEESNVFVYKKKKYDIKGRLSTIVVLEDSLVFYSNLGKESMLYFIGKEDRVYRIPRITTMDVKENTTVVATVEGQGVVYQDEVYYSSTTLRDLPVTGISFDRTSIYTSHLNGNFNKIRRISSTEWYFKRISIGVILLGIILYLLFRITKSHDKL